MAEEGEERMRLVTHQQTSWPRFSDSWICFCFLVTWQRRSLVNGPAHRLFSFVNNSPIERQVGNLYSAWLPVPWQLGVWRL